jgi:small subunit ribosomal protein S5
MPFVSFCKAFFEFFRIAIIMMSVTAETKNDGLTEKTIFINRTTKVVKGGRVFGFSALVVVGNRAGRFGIGRGKAREVQAAIQKALESARRSMVQIDLNNGTLYHMITSTHGASKVLMKPASEGTGVIAGNAMRAIFEVLGVTNVLAKSIGSSNPVNVVRATLKGLKSMVSPASVAEKRGKTIEEIFG